MPGCSTAIHSTVNLTFDFSVFCEGIFSMVDGDF